MPIPTWPARLRALVAVWLAFKIISSAPALRADLLLHADPPQHGQQQPRLADTSQRVETLQPADAQQPADVLPLRAAPAARAYVPLRAAAAVARADVTLRAASVARADVTLRVASVARAANGTHAGDSARDSLQRFEFHEPHMGTDTRVVLYASDEHAAGVAARAAFDRIEALNGVLSDYQPTSELMLLSARAGSGAVAVSNDLFRVLAAAQDIALRSNGAFDVTCGPLTRLWRRARHLSELPTDARLEEARALTGYRAMQLDPRARTATLAKPGMSLDVGGIAKGYAAEEALNVLTAHGIPRALVALGGDIAVGDPPPEREGWLVDVATIDGAASPGPIALRNASISTAGDAEQWLTVDGVRYSHILDPRSGRPMTIRSSTTVIAPHGLDADGLDDAAALLGIDRGLALIGSTPGAAVFMTRIEADGRVISRISSGWPPRAAVNQTAERDVKQTEPPHPPDRDLQR
jgi:FAD:protein FMN transferase